MARSALLLPPLMLILAGPAAAQSQPEHRHAARPTTNAPSHAAGRSPSHTAPGHAGPGNTPPAKPAAPPPAPAAAEAPAAPLTPAKGSNTGLPLPRFASLKSDDVNLRTGPGLRYPIEWVYKRRDLPVQIEREFEAWRLISDQEGVKGWVHQATLVGRRTFVVTGGEQTMRTEAADTASSLARLKPGVIGRIRACEANAGWCQVQVADYRGWLKRDGFWGISPGEAIQ